MRKFHEFSLLQKPLVFANIFYLTKIYDFRWFRKRQNYKFWQCLGHWKSSISKGSENWSLRIYDSCSKIFDLQNYRKSEIL